MSKEKENRKYKALRIGDVMCSLTYTKDGDCKSYNKLKILKGDRNKIVESLNYVSECYIFKGDYIIKFDDGYFVSEIIPL